MKITIEIPDADVDTGLSTIMASYPIIQQNDPRPTLICVEQDDDNMVYKFFDVQTSKSYTLCKDNLRAAITTMLSTDHWEDAGHERFDNSGSFDSWAENLDDNEVNDFIQLACLGNIPYENELQ